MTDMRVDYDPLSPTFGDVIYDNTGATTTEDIGASVAQKLTIRLTTFRGEWFINTTHGVPYYQEIFGKVRSKQTIDLIFQQQILQEPAVVEITEFSSEIRPDRTYSLNFRVRITNGQITDNIQINLGA
jgi:hypothetical protein